MSSEIRACIILHTFKSTKKKSSKNILPMYSRSFFPVPIRNFFPFYLFQCPLYVPFYLFQFSVSSTQAHILTSYSIVVISLFPQQENDSFEANLYQLVTIKFGILDPCSTEWHLTLALFNGTRWYWPTTLPTTSVPALPLSRPRCRSRETARRFAVARPAGVQLCDERDIHTAPNLVF